MVTRVARRTVPSTRLPMSAPERPVMTARTFAGGLFVNRDEHVVVGIDASYTGFALVAMGLSGERWYGWLMSTSSDVSRPQRLYRIEEFLFRAFEAINESCQVEHVLLEDYARNRKQGREEAGELGYAVRRTLCEIFGWAVELAYPTLVAPQALKKFVASGAGSNVRKQQMMLHVEKKWQPTPTITDDNVCDAYSLCRVGLAITSGHTDRAYEREVIAKLSEHTEWKSPPQHSPNRRERPTATRSRSTAVKSRSSA